MQMLALLILMPLAPLVVFSGVELITGRNRDSVHIIPTLLGLLVILVALFRRNPAKV